MSPRASSISIFLISPSFLARVKATEYAQYVHACSQSQSSFWSYDLGNRLVCVPVYGDVASRESDIRDYVESIGWIFLAGSVHSYTRSYSRRNRSWFFGWLDAMQRGNRELIVEDIRDAFMPRPTRKDRATSAYDIPQQDKDEIRWWTRRARYTHPPRALSYACRIINLCLSESLDYGAGDDRWIATCKTILDDSLLHAVGLNEDALEDCWRLYE